MPQESAILGKGSPYNTIGVELPHYLVNQLNTRSEMNLSETGRTNDQLKFIANKSAWVRVVSSVDVSGEDIQYFKKTMNTSQIALDPFSDVIQITDPSSLAKNFVLFGGTSKYDRVNKKYGLRSGLGEDGAYGILGDEEIKGYGYRPMPGITSVNIDTAGRLGSIRYATVSFKVWDKLQLDIIDALYFKLGYSMFIEWGQTYYYKTKTPTDSRGDLILQSSEDVAVDPFYQNWTKEALNLQIARSSMESEGNYDGMLGVCSNFNFSLNQEGGYDCFLKIIGFGVLADSIKINQPDSLTRILDLEVKKLINNYNREQEVARLNAQRQRDAELAANAEKPAESVDVNTVLVALLVRNRIAGYDQKTYEEIQKHNILSSENWQIANLQNFYNGYLSNVFLPFDYKGNFPTTNKKDYLSVDYRNLDGSYILGRFGVAIDVSKVKDHKYSATLDANKINNVAQHVVLNQGTIYNIVTETTGLEHALTFGENFIGNSIQSDNVRLGAVMIDIAKAQASSVAVASTPGEQDYYTEYSIKYTSSLDESQQKREYEITYSIPAFARYQEKIDQTVVPASNTTTVDLKDTKEIINETIKGKFDLVGIFAENGKINYKLQYNYDLKKVGKATKKTKLAGGGFREEEIEKCPLIYTAKVWVIVQDSYLFSNFESSTKEEQFSNYEQYQKDLSTQNPPQQPQDKNEEESIKIGDVQKEESAKYKSGLEIVLRAIQLHSISSLSSSEIKNVERVNLLEKEFANSIFGNHGIFKSVFTDLVNNSKTSNTDVIEDYVNYINPNTTEKIRFFIAAKYGFASCMLSDRVGSLEGNGPNVSNLKPINYKELLNSYVVPYRVDNSTLGNSAVPITYPVYINLGTLLMILNHMCGLYDTKEGKETDKVATPLVYIDFNTETNLCLSCPQHMSVNPLKFLIPFYGNKQQYKKLFDPKVFENEDKIKGYNSTESSSSYDPSIIFDPKNSDAISFSINETCKFKVEDNKSDAYRGKLMNVLISIDYILDTIKTFSTGDGNSSVYLRSFLERVSFDMNTALGSFNLFRVAYNDRANTLYIIDDQIIPVPERIRPENTSSELPLYGKKSIARALDIKTEISSKLASVIAISSNASPEYMDAISQDATSFGFINSNFKDRYIPIKQSKSVKNKKDKDILGEDIKSAQQFNEIVYNFFGSPVINPEDINYATNYYTQKMATVKSQSSGSRASVMIPISLNFTTDGIGGISMYQSFTVSEDLLPYTYAARSDRNLGYDKDCLNKIGFCIVGLTHRLENNSWTTDVRANMVYTKRESDYQDTVDIVGSQKNFRDTNSSDSSVLNFQKAGFIKNQGKALTEPGFDEALTAMCDRLGCNKNDMLAVMRAESGLDPSAENIQGGHVVAAGLIQFTKASRPNDYLTMSSKSGVEQLKYVEQYYAPYKGNLTNVYKLYAVTFLPAIVNHINEDNKVLEFKNLSAERISSQNPAVARAAGKSPGDPLTIGDFKKYVRSII